MRNEAATGGDILGDAVTGGVAGAGFGGLVVGGLTASALDQVARGNDRILRRIVASRRLRDGSVATMALLGAALGGASGFALGGGSRWIGGRPVEKRGMKDLSWIKGLPSQFKSPRAISPVASLPKMKLPSTLAREQAGMVTKKLAEVPMKRYVKVASPVKAIQMAGAKLIHRAGALRGAAQDVPGVGAAARRTVGAAGVTLGKSLVKNPKATVGVGAAGVAGGSAYMMGGKKEASTVGDAATGAAVGGVGVGAGVAGYHGVKAYREYSGLRGKGLGIPSSMKRDFFKNRGLDALRKAKVPAAIGAGAGLLVGAAARKKEASKTKDPEADAGARFRRGAGLATALAVPEMAAQYRLRAPASMMALTGASSVLTGGVAGLIVGQGEKGEGRGAAAARGAKRHGIISGGLGAAVGAGVGGATAGPKGALVGSGIGAVAGGASGALGGAIYGYGSKPWWGKKEASFQETGIVGDLESPGLFAATAQGLLDRLPAPVADVMAGSEAYQGLGKTAGIKRLRRLQGAAAKGKDVPSSRETAASKVSRRAGRYVEKVTGKDSSTGRARFLRAQDYKHTSS